MTLPALPPLEVTRRPEKFAPDASRVLIRPFIPVSEQRVTNIIGRILLLSEAEARAQLDQVAAEFFSRHLDLEGIFERHYSHVKHLLLTDREPSRTHRLLIGSYFTSEYALESAALFNPSIVPHPDQTGVPEGSMRFIMSLRATGEGHISSIEFRSGLLNGQEIKLDPVTRHVTAPEIILHRQYERATFEMKLHEMGFDSELFTPILSPLGDHFNLTELEQTVLTYRTQSRIASRDELRTLDCIQWLAHSNYEIEFEPDQLVSERIIFPISSNESNGIEDARFVRFADEDGKVKYYATYTAYNGKVILPQLLETADFLKFRVITLNGRAVQNKGMALFPRKIDGKYAMISRQDNENIFIMFSGHLHFWNETSKLMRPTYPWEYVQLGNCGSPIETEAGWLLLTHGVGPMRKYCIGAILLDLEDPTRIIGRLREPLLKPNENEREGYVPNVVYTCGAMIHRNQLVLPYAMSDSASSIATIPVDDLLKHLAASPP